MAPPFVQITLCPGPAQEPRCHVGGTDGVQGAESPPQVVPGHDWHILRSQEMLCTAPAAIKHSCSPAAPQCIPNRLLTLQPLTYLPFHMFTYVQTPPHAPSLQTPYLPSNALLSHPIHSLPHLQHTLTT